jgi:photosystem II stability/assembly factor-like uncharacterized protein
MKRSVLLIVGLTVMLSACKKTVDVSNVETLYETGVEFDAIDVRGDSIVVVGGSRYDFGSLFISYDSQNWSKFDSLSSKALYDVDWFAPSRLITVGYDGKFFKSEDFGQNFLLSQLMWENIRAVEANDNKAWLCGGKGLNKGFITRIDDINIPSSYTQDTLQNEMRCFVKTSDGALYAGGYGIILKSTDNGITWNATSAEGDFFIGLVELNGALYAGGINGTVLKSNDAGATWEHVKRGNNPLNVGVLFNAFDGNENGLVLAGENGNAFRYNFGTDKWERLDLNTDDDITGLKIRDQVVYGCTRQGRVIKFNLP